MALPIPLVPKHLNDGECAHCDLIFKRYPGFHTMLWAWFKAFQKAHPEAHISCAGRGYLDQEMCFVKKVSKAHYGESSHNFNAAIDLFEMRNGDANIYERDWFDTILANNLEPWMSWYGKPGSPYYELPHVEVAQWKTLVKTGALNLVDPPASVKLFSEKQ